MNKLYLRFYFLDDLIKIHFFIFINIDDEKERKFNSSSVFEEFYLNLRKNFGNSWTQVILDNLNTQKVELHTNPCWSYQTISLVCRYIYICIYIIYYIYILYIYLPNAKQSMEFLYSWAKSHHSFIPWSNFEINLQV